MGKRPRLAKSCGLYWQQGREHPEPWELAICGCRDARSAHYQHGQGHQGAQAPVGEGYFVGELG